MFTDLFTRRQFSAQLGSLLAMGAVGRGGMDHPVTTDDVSYSSEAIHQEASFNATPQRVYEALTDAKRFTAVTALGPLVNAPPAQIAHEVGGTFVLFGGHILGRHVELVPGQRIVQAWRTADWAPGVYSIAQFELKAQGAKTSLVFDHTGFPRGEGKSLAAGWHAHYWEPLRKYLG